jgi:FtsZ-interacting cell division protein ZipA
MSTGLIIAIIVVVVVLILAGLIMSRARAGIRAKRRERELGRRRETAVHQHNTAAEARAERADAAEQRARIAQQEAQRERAEAELHRERATMVEQGHADDRLMGDDEHRSADANGNGAPARDARDGELVGERERERER